MNELADIVARWFDPQTVGAFLLAWGGRVLGALAILVSGRLVARALHTHGFGIPPEHRATSLVAQTAGQ